MGGETNTREATGLVTALDTTDGSERWRWTTRGFWTEDGDKRAGTTAPVSVADGAVFAATGAGDLYALA